MEKLALTLVHDARRLKRYFLGHAVKVVTDKPINQILNSPEASGRLAKWAVELGVYGITYALRNAIKGQVLADFLANTMAGYDSTSGRNPSLKVTLDSKEVPESSKGREEQANLDPVAEADTWKLYTDKASNDHGSEAGLILIDPEGLRLATRMKVNKMHAFVDSKLLASQVEGSYESQGEKAKKYKLESFGDSQVLRQIPDKPHTKRAKQEGRCAKFGVLATLITDNETHLINEPFKSWAKGLEIKLISTFENAKNEQRGNPFSLAYGTEAVIPTEIGMPIRRTTQRTNEENDVELRLNLNLLEKQRELTIIRESRRKQQVEKYYNQRVHHRQFRTGEFVLRKMKCQRQRIQASSDQNGKGHMKSLKHTTQEPTSSGPWTTQKYQEHGIQVICKSITCKKKLLNPQDKQVMKNLPWK
ncbi:reverse transcriptase domain-containing protein [Tanacetum coccineum]